ncbi:MAG: hypothetical protein Q9227_000642 [Pyrenula ochraceoflavens]
MRIPKESLQLVRRATDDSGGGNSSAFIAVAVVAAVLVVALISSYFVLRRVRRHNYNPKYVPGTYLKRKWQSWVPHSYGRVRSHTRGVSEDVTNINNDNARQSTSEEQSAAESAAAGVDRNTSVRSVMTLPSYTANPREAEQVIGREGERAGIDTVIENPETADQEESRREEEMESLYQIRVARRREVAEREARRQARREARAAGDHERLENLRRESRLRAQNGNGSTTDLSSAILLAEHQSRPRDRRISEAAYAGVGHVRHDGTRLRADSNDSERGGLLSGAAPMGQNERRSSSQNRDVSGHNRNISGSSSLMFEALPLPGHARSGSALSISTSASDVNPGEATPPSTNDHSSRSRNRGSDPQASSRSSGSPTAIRITPTTSNSNSDSADLGDAQIPEPLPNSAGTEPPNYEMLDWGDAPPYSSPIRNRESAPTLERQLLERARAAAAAGDRNSAASLAQLAERARATANDSPTSPTGAGNRDSTASLAALVERARVTAPNRDSIMSLERLANRAASLRAAGNRDSAASLERHIAERSRIVAARAAVTPSANSSVVIPPPPNRATSYESVPSPLSRTSAPRSATSSSVPRQPYRSDSYESVKSPLASTPPPQPTVTKSSPPPAPSTGAGPSTTSNSTFVRTSSPPPPAPSTGAGTGTGTGSNRSSRSSGVMRIPTLQPLPPLDMDLNRRLSSGGLPKINVQGATEPNTPATPAVKEREGSPNRRETFPL